MCSVDPRGGGIRVGLLKMMRTDGGLASLSFGYAFD